MKGKKRNNIDHSFIQRDPLIVILKIISEEADPDNLLHGRVHGALEPWKPGMYPVSIKSSWKRTKHRTVVCALGKR